MNTANSHWTERSTEDFQYRIASDFVAQLDERMQSKPLKRNALASRLGVSVGRVSQVLNDPGNLSLKTIIRYARALGMKVAIVAYDDGDRDNNNGPVNSQIFQMAWERIGAPRDFFDIDKPHAQEVLGNVQMLCVSHAPVGPATSGFINDPGIASQKGIVFGAGTASERVSVSQQRRYGHGGAVPDRLYI